jgi:uncharacterized protein
VRWLAVSALLAMLAACSETDDDPHARRVGEPTSRVTFDGSGAVLRVRVADDADERRRGLMGVTRLGEDEGMAFVFAAPVDNGFWMKDTLIPLSIAFVDESGRIVTIREMRPCDADPCPRHGAVEPYVLAIEANRGWFDRSGVEVGERARLEVAPDG